MLQTTSDMFEKAFEEAIGFVLNGLSKAFLSLKEKRALCNLISGLLLMQKGDNHRASDYFMKINIRFDGREINYKMADCLAGSCNHDVPDFQRIAYSQKAIELFMDLYEQIKDEEDQYAERSKLCCRIGQMMKVYLQSSIKAGKFAVDSESDKILHFGLPLIVKADNLSIIRKWRLINRYQEYYNQIFYILEKGFDLAEKNDLIEQMNDIKYQQACLFAMLNNDKKVEEIYLFLLKNGGEEIANKLAKRIGYYNASLAGKYPEYNEAKAE